jgi:uncharacterized membrane protein YhaH (DUF805 family)
MATLTADALVNRLIDRGRERWKSLVVFALVGGVVGVFVVSSMVFAWLMVVGGIAFVAALALD